MRVAQLEGRLPYREALLQTLDLPLQGNRQTDWRRLS